MRGITNIHGTSCHTSASLQLLHHCFPTLRVSILELASVSADYHVEEQYYNKVKTKEGNNVDEEDLEIIECEFVYQLSWFYYLLAHNVDILDVARTKHRARIEEEGKEEKVRIAKEKEEAATNKIAAASVLGVVAVGGAAAVGGMGDSNEKEQQKVSHEEFQAILSQASSKKQTKPGSPNSHRRKHKHHKKKKHKDPSSPGSKSHRSHRRQQHTGSASVASSTTSSQHLKGTSEMNSIQRAAIAAFMTKARSGQSTTSDWQKLVDIMKNNRIGYNDALTRVLDEHKRSESEGKNEEENEGGTNNKNDNDNGNSALNRAVGNLGGSKSLSAQPSNPTNDSAAIDPSSFYQHINTYTTALSSSSSSTSSSNIQQINTSNVGDAAQVFRCLVNALEYSTNEEMNRLQSIIDVLEIDSWNERGGGDDDEKINDEKQQQQQQQQQQRERQLISLLQRIQLAIQHSFSGTLISRIVGTSISVTTMEDNNPMIPTVSSTQVTEIRKVQRTKKHGGIVRALPAPFVLPVVKADIPSTTGGGGGSSKKKQKKSSTKEDAAQPTAKKYYPSIEESLHSVTIFPNPIRGYDWRGLIKRDEVVEDVFVKRVDGDGNEIIDDEEDDEVDENDGSSADDGGIQSSRCQESQDELIVQDDNNREEEGVIQDDGVEDVFISDVNSYSDERSISSTEFNFGGTGSVTGSITSAAAARRQQRSAASLVDNDDSSVLSTASRSIAVQTEYDENGNVIHDVNVKTIEVTTPRGENSEEKKDDASNSIGSYADSCYAAAVSAIVSSRGRSTSVASRHRSRAVARDGKKPGRSANERSSRAQSIEKKNEVTAQEVRSSSAGIHSRRGSYQGRSVEQYNRVRGTSVDSRRSLRGTSVERRSSQHRHRGATAVNSNGSHMKRSSSVGRMMVEATTAASVVSPSATTTTGPKTVSYKSSPSFPFSSVPGITTPAGMTVGPSPSEPTQQGITASNTPTPADNKVVLPLDSDSSSSSDESSMDDQVSSVDTDTTSEDEEEDKKQSARDIGEMKQDDNSFSTHSSDIATPENLDELSLGSFTDDSLSDVEVNLLVERDDMKQESDNDLHNETAVPTAPQAPLDDNKPVIETDTAAPTIDPMEGTDSKSPAGMEVVPLVPSASSASHSAVSDSNSDNSSSSDDNSSTSSSSSSSSSSDDDTSSTDTDSSSSSDSEENDDTPPSVESSTEAIVASAATPPSSDEEDDENSANSDTIHQQPTNEWVTRKETRLCHPLPQSLIFHLKRFEYSTTLGRVEKLAGKVKIPQELDLKACSLGVEKDKKSCCHRYSLSGGIVHVDPIEKEGEIEYGEASEGHYVTILCHSSVLSNEEDETKEQNITWTEIDDEVVREVEIESALEVLSGCEKDKERRYATLVVYSRNCKCDKVGVS